MVLMINFLLPVGGDVRDCAYTQKHTFMLKGAGNEYECSRHARLHASLTQMSLPMTLFPLPGSCAMKKFHRHRERREGERMVAGNFFWVDGRRECEAPREKEIKSQLDTPTPA
ncbi:hypothetical protein TcCL_NonESM01039 [Trypanosoma cruzi]|nr:hypothetical protein TcCL_NonESM01039 [Trypanosoma cruzi]